MNNRSMLSCIPLHLEALEVAPNILPWVQDWLSPDSISLKPEECFELGHEVVGWTTNCDNMEVYILRKEYYIWSPPPSAADIALEQMRKARLKRQDSWHFFLVPKLFTELLHKHLFQACNIVFEMEAKEDVWLTSNF